MDTITSPGQTSSASAPLLASWAEQAIVATDSRQGHELFLPGTLAPLKNMVITPKKKAMSANIGMESLVRTVNQLQDIFGKLENKDLAFSLPQIAVVGGQSSGKSSVLEGVVGKDFLPRGTGIVTRCPLILQMNNTDCDEHWVFEHLPGQKFTDADDVREEIIEQTDKINDTPKGVSSTPITLKFYSPKVLDITLVDLPGLTRIAIEGQPADIATTIRDLVSQYINNENVLILAITPANQDLATSDALNVAEKADPNFDRTFGVLTKLDLVEPEYEKAVRDTLDNKTFKLKYGYNGVINRSQKDIDDDRDIEFAIAKEVEYIEKKRWLKPIKSRLGTPHLQTVLNQQLSEHIGKFMPKIEANIKLWLLESVNKLKTFGNTSEDDTALVTRLTDLVKQIEGNFSSSLGSSENADSTKKSRGFQLREQLDTYPATLHEITFEEESIKQQMSRKMLNLQGLEPGIFPPDKAVVGLIKEHAEHFMEPSLLLLKVIEQSMMFSIKELVDILREFPKLRKRAQKLMERELQRCSEEAEIRIQQFAEEDKVYVNTQTAEFRVAFKKLERESKPLFIVSNGLHQELCTGIVLGSDNINYNCALTPASIRFKRNYENNDDFDELAPTHEVQSYDYKIECTSSSFRIDLKKKTGGITYLCSHANIEPTIRNKWIKELRGLETSKNKKRMLFGKLDLLKSTMNDDDFDAIPQHVQNSVDTMYEIFIRYIQTTKDKYSDHIPKLISCVLVFRFKDYIERGLLAELIAPQDLKELMTRSPDAMLHISNLKEEIVACEEALEIIESIPI